MESSLASEVDATLSKMDDKYDVDYPALKDSSSKDNLVKSLYKEFDSLGIYEKKDDVNNRKDLLNDIICNSFKLIHIHRLLLEKCTHNKCESTRLKENNGNLQKKIGEGQTVLRTKHQIIEQAGRELVLKQMEIDDLDASKNRLQHDLNVTKKLMQNDRKQMQHEIKRLQCEIEQLKEFNKKQIGSFASRDSIFVATMEKYKQNEEIYNDTIRKLQENNGQLLEEILNLKQEVLTVLCKDNS